MLSFLNSPFLRYNNSNLCISHCEVAIHIEQGANSDPLSGVHRQPGKRPFWPTEIVGPQHGRAKW